MKKMFNALDKHVAQMRNTLTRLDPAHILRHVVFPRQLIEMSFRTPEIQSSKTLAEPMRPNPEKWGVPPTHQWLGRVRRVT